MTLSPYIFISILSIRPNLLTGRMCNSLQESQGDQRPWVRAQFSFLYSSSYAHFELLWVKLRGRWALYSRANWAFADRCAPLCAGGSWQVFRMGLFEGRSRVKRATTAPHSNLTLDVFITNNKLGKRVSKARMEVRIWFWFLPTRNHCTSVDRS